MGWGGPHDLKYDVYITICKNINTLLGFPRLINLLKTQIHMYTYNNNNYNHVQITNLNNNKRI